MAMTIEAIAVATGRRIRAHRTAKGWSQERLAREAGGLSKETIRRAEKGEAMADWSTLKALADALGCELADLVDLAGSGPYLPSEIAA